MRQRARRLLDLRDRDTAGAMVRLRAAAEGEPDPGACFAELLGATLEAVEELKVPFARAVDDLLAAFAANAGDPHELPPADAVVEGGA